MTDGTAVERLLLAARSRLRRLTPAEAYDAVRTGALLVDIRPEAHRRAEGAIPGALVVERNVLEWRFDPEGAHRLDVAAPDLHVVLVCNEGYASSLAAASLQDVGVPHATDLVGGSRAWRAAGLPVEHEDPGVVAAGPTGQAGG